jgi:pantothenate kinase
MTSAAGDDVTTSTASESRAIELSVDALVERAMLLTLAGRAVLGIAGAPGSGKSTLAEQIAGRLGPQRAVVVGMDAFHLDGAELDRLGRAERKGAPDTFDVAGFVALLDRVRAQGDEIVYAPIFDRYLEASIAGAVAILPDVPLVITEGNYLLVPEQPWAQVRSRLDTAWFVDVAEPELTRRLTARHIGHGRRDADAVAWVREVDGPNIRTVDRTRHSADLIVRPRRDEPPSHLAGQVS